MCRFLGDIPTILDNPEARWVVTARQLEETDIAGALLLSASMQWLDTQMQRERRGRRVRSNLHETDARLSHLFHELGVFGMKKTGAPSIIDKMRLRVLKIRKGLEADGRVAKKVVQEELTEVVGRSAPQNVKLVNGIIEALGNVREHAYDKSMFGHAWWVAAAYDKGKGVIHVAV